MRTKAVKPTEAPPQWHLVDADNKVLGRMATQIARLLQGKHKAEYTPNINVGDYVIVINAAKVRVTGNKAKDKKYYRYSGYPGGLKEISFEKMMAKNPCVVIEKAVKGMLPKGPLGRQMFKRLKVYADAEHQHAAQQPELIEV